jgi:16S rRNA (guanine527-N7)-methyltransferase
MATASELFKRELQRSAPEFGVEFRAAHERRLGEYYELLLKWNPRLHLVAPCSPEEFAVRHVLESLSILKHLPQRASLIDIGTGAGLPTIPCLLVRHDLRATLIESSQRKAVFLRQALRLVTPADRAQLLVSRFQDAVAPEAGFITCRALDRFSSLVPTMVAWSRPNTTFLFFAGDVLRRQIESILSVETVERLPRAEKRFLIVARKNQDE